MFAIDRFIRAALAVVAATLLLGPFVGCAMLQTPPKAPENVTVSYVLPSLTPVGTGTETQDRGGVVVQMAPMPFTAERKVVKSCVEQPTVLVMNHQYQYEVRETPSYQVSPDHFVFKVKVTNHTDQVLKLEGIVFKFNVNDQEIALEEDTYKTFTSGILTPGQQKEYDIRGPEWKALPKDGNVNFSIFGLPTETDAAGNVTKRENFEWTFTFKAEDKSEQVQVPVNVVSMTKEEAAQCSAVTPPDTALAPTTASAPESAAPATP